MFSSTVTVLLPAAVVAGLIAVFLRLAAFIRQSKPISTSLAATQVSTPRDGSYASVRRLSARRQCLTTVYVLMWLVRCVLLTMTFGSVALRIQLGTDLATVGRSAKDIFYGRISQDGASLIGSHATTADWDVIGLAENEARRRGKRWKAMREACETYINQMTDVVLAEVFSLHYIQMFSYKLWYCSMRCA